MSDTESDNLNNLVTNLNFEVATMKSEAMDLNVEVEFGEQKMKGSRKSTRLNPHQEGRERETDGYGYG